MPINDTHTRTHTHARTMGRHTDWLVRLPLQSLDNKERRKLWSVMSHYFDTIVLLDISHLEAVVTCFIFWFFFYLNRRSAKNKINHLGGLHEQLIGEWVPTYKRPENEAIRQIGPELATKPETLVRKDVVNQSNKNVILAQECELSSTLEKKNDRWKSMPTKWFFALFFSVFVYVVVRLCIFLPLKIIHVCREKIHRQKHMARLLAFLIGNLHLRITIETLTFIKLVRSAAAALGVLYEQTRCRKMLSPHFMRSSKTFFP